MRGTFSFHQTEVRWVHLREHLQKGRHIPGILLLRPRASYQQIIDTLDLICMASVPEDFRDQITYIPY